MESATRAPRATWRKVSILRRATTWYPSKMSVDPASVAVLALISIAKSGIAQAWKWHSAKGAAVALAENELSSAYEYAARLAGSVLFELRFNVERIRLVVEKATDGEFPLAPFDFTVSEAVMPRLCEVAPTPKLLSEFQLALAAVRRVDFFQRFAAAPQTPIPDAYLRLTLGSESAHHAVSFARDALAKGLVDRFNLLRDVTAGIGAAGLPSWDAVEATFLPGRVDIDAAIDHSML